MKEYTVALAGNPNTGKSTVFNALTGLNQHTGNWSGKTVEKAVGKYTFEDTKFLVADLPGVYSLYSDSAEEKCAKDYIVSNEADVVVVIADATCLERNLNLCIQITDIFDNVVLCLNIIDEAKKKGIIIDVRLLSETLGIPVICASARDGKGIRDIKKTVFDICEKNIDVKPKKLGFKDFENEERSRNYIKKTEEICSDVIKNKGKASFLAEKADKVLLSKKFGIPTVIIMICLLFIITARVSNYPCDIISSFLSYIGERFEYFLNTTPLSPQVISLIYDGIFTTTAFVVSVMLPPMAIFFPLFTFLEDCGFLPRIAFCLVGIFSKADAHGKQAVTSMMAFGCNAAAITNCRIIESKRERLIAIVTNNFIPCNGRFPLIIVLTSSFIANGNLFIMSAAIIAFIVMAIGITFLVSKILSMTILKGMRSSFVLELPPYRRPQIGKILVRSILDRTIFVLGRAITAAAPAGALIWLLQNIYVGDISVINAISEFLDPFAKVFGLNGIILAAFFVAFPANEMVLPVVYMCLGGAYAVSDIGNMASFMTLLCENGWTYVTAFCTILFSMNHFPCATALLTIKKETESLFWTFMAFIIPLFTGFIVCFTANFLLNLI